MEHEALLGKICLLREEFGALINAKQKFNIISVLRKERDEVGLHSRIIAEMLSPDGNHGCGKKNLEAFLSQLGIYEFCVEKVTVRREYKNVDIYVVNNKKQAIIIENKIDACDQDNQISRYLCIAKDEGYLEPWVVYLTLDGRAPSNISITDNEKKAIGDNGKYIQASYKCDILNWLDSIIHNSADIDLNVPLLQYKNILNKITGNSLPMEYVDQIKSLLFGSREYFSAAVDLSCALNKAKIDLQMRYWDRLRNAIEKKGCTLSTWVKTDDIENFYNGSRNTRDFYLSTDIVKNKYAVSMDGCLDLGVSNEAENKASIKKINNEFAKIKSQINCEFGVVESESSEHWPWYISVASGIDFVNINEKALSLLDDEVLDSVVDDVSDKYVRLVGFLKNIEISV